ncbi:Aste57867_15759 [Aphanomyces stellatus]|uniref:Aste57867_1046 protein n=1 Tax=Aphanomyces stellatus TaxID=120398 RepID=A0A485L4X3_9STRA|nr:hypothetical protein As57867_015703 [Aphanomyces stellatus]KAF0719450.1 hypothetical protein As57867_001045 [Aphanomyces stellatus]VFT78268.1 Aste57867_1046 [Aphanomyces stellatus]VFT92548.1 Aste57867_15759 [Aphanomyces stellatus]
MTQPMAAGDTAATLAAVLFTEPSTTVRSHAVGHQTDSDAAMGRTFVPALDTFDATVVAAALPTTMGATQAAALAALVTPADRAASAAAVGLAQSLGLRSVATELHFAALSTTVAETEGPSSGSALAVWNLAGAAATMLFADAVRAGASDAGSLAAGRPRVLARG